MVRSELYNTIIEIYGTFEFTSTNITDNETLVNQIKLKPRKIILTIP